MNKFINFLKKYYFNIFLCFIISFFGFYVSFLIFNKDFNYYCHITAMYEKILIKEFGTTFDSYEAYLYYKIYGK